MNALHILIADDVIAEAANNATHPVLGVQRGANPRGRSRSIYVAESGRDCSCGGALATCESRRKPEQRLVATVATAWPVMSNSECTGVNGVRQRPPGLQIACEEDATFRIAFRDLAAPRPNVCPEQIDDPNVRPQSLAVDISEENRRLSPPICNMGEGPNTNFDVDRAAHHAVCTVASAEIFGLNVNYSA
jgi:hypothetical protein